MTDRIDGYAAAAFELARAEGAESRVQQELESLAGGLEQHEELRQAFSDPRLPDERKQAIVEDLLGGRASELTINLVNLIVSQGRGGDLPAIAHQMAQRAAASEGKELAEVRSAIPLDDETVRRLASALEGQLGRPVEIKNVVDPSVVGGIVTRVGDTVIDGTVRRRLESLRQTLQSQNR